MNNYSALITTQKQFFNSSQSKDVNFRIEKLSLLKKVLKDNESRLYEAVYQDFQKSEFDTYITEVAPLYKEIDLCIKKIKNWSKIKRVKTDLSNFPASSCIIPEPLGCILVIGAWNFPYRLSLMPAIAALGAGNTVILKPSEVAPNTSNIIADIINSNFEKEYFQVIEGGVEESTKLLKLNFDKIFYTGSTRVGQIVYEAAAKNLTPVTLELGGKSPAFVLEDCDIDKCVKRISWAKFLNAGQTCVAPDYVLVEKSIENKFLEALSLELNKSYSQDEVRENYSQIVNQSNYYRLVNLIDDDKLYYGGNTEETERFISPTILSKISFDDEVMKEEIFGPILPVISFENLDKVIAKVKSLPKPLACYIYSDNRKKINKILNSISFGGGAINDSVVHLSNPNLPFGGVGMSGIGSCHGKYGFDTFTHYKSIVHKSNWIELPLKYFPYSDFKKKIIKIIFEL